MGWETILLYVLCGVVLILTWAGILEKTPRGQRMARFLSPMGARIFNTIIIIVVIILATIFN